MLSTCHRLLEARVPCLWRPVASSDEQTDILRAIVKGETPPTNSIASKWEVWVFHVLVPERNSKSLNIIPAEFKLVDSGEMFWNASLLQTAKGTVENKPDIDVHSLFYRSLDNLVDKALIPLSIVRFGFRQWITLDKASQPEIGLGETDACEDYWQLPPTPASPSTYLQPDANDFIANSSKLEHKPSGNCRQAKNDLTKSECKSAADVYIIRFTASALSHAVLLQHNTLKLPSLRPMAQLEQILSQYSTVLPRLQTPDNKLAPIAIARIAPYGSLARIVAVPSASLDESEGETLESWSSLFGYSKSMLEEYSTLQQTSRSNLVWITMTDSDEPMLYPCRLVFIDLEATAALYAPGSEASISKAAENTTKQHVASDMDMDTEPVKSDALEEAISENEREEGEDDGHIDEEDDEEGEIADPSEELEHETPLATADMDEVVAGLYSQYKPALDVSEIQKSMAQFQAELQAEEEVRKRERKQTIASNKEAQATGGSSKGTGTKANGARKRQRSNARDNPPNKSRRKTETSNASGVKDTKSDSSNDDIPLQALVQNTTLSTPAAAATVTESAASNGADIDALFGGTQNPEQPEGGQNDMGLEFGQMGDDMGLGMVMGMGDNLGDFGTSMFGVTDDDFSFFDSAPAPQLKMETVMSQPAVDMDAMAIDLKSEPAFGNSSQPVDALVSADSNQPLPDAIDDLLDDDNMFDSFFGAPTSAADLSTAANTSAIQTTAADAAFMVSSDANTVNTAAVATSSFSGENKPTLINSLSSPPGIASVLSATETHVGSVEPPTLSMDMELATPASIKMTPAPSTDILTPTPTANPQLLPKSSLDSDVSARGQVIEPVVCTDASSSGLAPISLGLQQPKGPNVAKFNALDPPVNPSRKPSFNSQHLKAMTTVTPARYRPIRTSFDDIGTSSKSWLNDQRTPASIDNIDDDSNFDLQAVQHASLIEKSLNPVSWIKRVSARRMQRQSMVGRHKSGLGAKLPVSIRRLRGWLTTYKAKLSYGKGFAPANIQHSDSKQIADSHGDAALDDSLDTTDVRPGISLRQNSDYSENAFSGLSNLQYSASNQQQQQQQQQHNAKERPADGNLPTFMSIINPRSTTLHATEANSVQMPGMLPLSLGMSSLQMATTAANECIGETLVSVQATVGSWVPLWMRISGGVADLTVGVSLVDGLTWMAVRDVLVPLTRYILKSQGPVHSSSYAAKVPAICFSEDKRLKNRDVSQSTSTATPVNNLGARIGGLLMLGVQQQPKAEAAEVADLGIEITQQDDEPIAVSKLISQLRIDSSATWTSIVEMLGDWAVHSLLLTCVDEAYCALDQYKAQDYVATFQTSDMLAQALTAFWGIGGSQISSQNVSSEGSEQLDVHGKMKLGKLVSLENTTPSPTSKYRGYVVKKRKTTAQVANSHTNATAATGGGEGSLVIPSGEGTIEPLLDVKVVVGTHGQQDVAVDGDTALRRRDAEAIYIKRWRYAQTLASKAAHEARVASGEIEEAEEGEEREDGDEAAEVEDWPDPDCASMEAEDALRRVCMVTSPTALRWWTQLHMRPIGASKDVLWAMFVPPRFEAHCSAAEGYLADVDSAYQTAHFGTHRPLGLQQQPNGIFTQHSECPAMPPSQPQTHDDNASWSARLRFEARRLGHCMAHAWYTSAQLEQQRRLSADSEEAPAAVMGSTTLVLYMLVPHAQALSLWLCIAEASCIALQSFEATLRSIIARTARGVPSSSSSSSATVDSHVPWPALVVHPLPLDAMYNGQRVESAFSPHATALAIFHRCPEPLRNVPTVAAAASPVVSQDGQQQSAETQEFISSVTGPASKGNKHLSSKGADCRLARYSSFFVNSEMYKDGIGGAPGFAHQAFVISMPTTYPLPGSAFAAATLSVSQARRRSDFPVEATEAGGMPAVPLISSSLQSGADSSSEQATRGDERLNELRLSFDFGKKDESVSLAARLTRHPLRLSDQMSTLHCMYWKVLARSGAWIAACFCDERGEFIEHDVFATTHGETLSPKAAARIWQGCLRFQRLFGGELRIIMAQWQGMSPVQARKWHSFADSWTRQHGTGNPVRLHTVSVGINACSGLQLACRAAPLEMGPLHAGDKVQVESTAQKQWSLVLQGQQPYIELDTRTKQLYEPLCNGDRWATGYLVQYDRSCTATASCLCIQLLDEQHAGQMALLRTVVSQYHQLGMLRHAQVDSASAAHDIYGWPLHLLPLPASIVVDLRCILEHIG
ncbi:hypothetical protein IWW36_000256 [Coemansia brasiliensis]|uniref:MID domain-containing protein n=1 Tax=Coemansia brasiliensis TaxID=2650707 RepID=A0A9W8IIV4_9FUNG|nr:hypothetical protein IWW36_000256 [Coemansia brasiliensis]